MRAAVGLAISMLVVAGCGGGLGGGSGGAGGASGRGCVPGMSVACACTTGLGGAQVCASDGASYGPCVCDGLQGAGGTTGTGGSTGLAGTTGTTGGGAGGTICDAPRLVFQSADLQRGCGSDAGCHGATLRASGLDLASAGVIARLLDKTPDPATSVSCAASTMPYLISSSNPAQGLLIDKLSATPSCGTPQPFPLGNLPADQKACLLQWATAVTTGVITQ